MLPPPPKVAVVGSLHTDLTVKAERIPVMGETVLGEDLKITMGGKGANQAVAASRLGAEVVLIGRVGADEFGNRMIENATAQRIETKYIVRDELAPSGVALIVIDGKGNNIITVSSGADSRCDEGDVDRAGEAIKSSQVLLAQLELPLRTVAHAIDVAHRHGVQVILNLSPARKVSKRMLRKVHILTLNETEAEFLSGISIKSLKGVAKRILELGPDHVVLTMGKRGSVLVTAEGLTRVKGVKVKAIDPTGAGDAFCGALAVAIASGEDLKEAVSYANCAGALATTRIGAQEALPTKEELEDFIRERKFGRQT